MHETFVRLTFSLGEAQRIAEVLADASFDDDAARFTDVVENGPFLSIEDLLEERG